MEKLIELLNEYEIKRMKTKMDITDKRTEGDLDNEYTPLIITSKKFGFIKWLVENDKIDYHNKINYHISLAIHWREKRTTREERLLMMLAIQDEPIRFLCEIIK